PRSYWKTAAPSTSPPERLPSASCAAPRSTSPCDSVLRRKAVREGRAAAPEAAVRGRALPRRQAAAAGDYFFCASQLLIASWVIKPIATAISPNLRESPAFCAA